MESQPRDLRHFLEILEEKWPGEVLRINTAAKPFSLTDCDAAAVLFRLRERGKKPAVLFEGFKTAGGKRWPGQLLFSELVTFHKQAAALDLSSGVDFEGLVREYTRRTKAVKLPVKIPSSEAPVKTTIIKDKVSLFDLPIYRKEEFDARPGWLCAVAVAREPESGRYNCSWHRHHVHSPEMASVRVNPRHLREYMNRYKARGADTIFDVKK